jgi:hypothetical protein
MTAQATGYTWQERHGGSEWPSRYPAPPTRWPAPGQRWTPDRAAAAAIVCVRVGFAQIVFWTSLREALEADRQLYDQRCGRGCVGVHLLVSTAPGRISVAPSIHQAELPSPAAQLAAEWARYRRRRMCES